MTPNVAAILRNHSIARAAAISSLPIRVNKAISSRQRRASSFPWNYPSPLTPLLFLSPLSALSVPVVNSLPTIPHTNASSDMVTQHSLSPVHCPPVLSNASSFHLSRRTRFLTDPNTRAKYGIMGDEETYFSISPLQVTDVYRRASPSNCTARRVHAYFLFQGELHAYLHKQHGLSPHDSSSCVSLQAHSQTLRPT